MNVTKKCDLCDTALEFEADGRRLTFRAHDAAFCRGATLMRLETMRRALEQAAQDRGEAALRLSWALRRNDAERRILRDALTQALEQWAGLYEDRRTKGQPVEHPEIERLERLLDERRLDDAVAAELRGREQEAELLRIMAEDQRRPPR